MRNSKPCLLVVDHEPQTRKMLVATLTASGYQVQSAQTMIEGLRLAGLYNPSAIILETALPDQSGVELIVALRQWSKTPVLVLSEQDAPDHVVRCLQIGANDFIAKPFNMSVLLARIQVALRDHMQQEVGASSLRCGRIYVDLLRHEAWLQGDKLELSPREFDLLSYLIRNRGKMLTHRQLLKALWGDGHSHDRQYLRVYIMQLRRKIESNPQQPEYILTETGVGYRMDGPADVRQPPPQAVA
jgi:two-component system KDP operon response regulator KdpE